MQRIKKKDSDVRKHLLAKIATLESKAQRSKVENRKLRQRYRELLKSCGSWKAKVQGLQQGIRFSLRGNKTRHGVESEYILGHKFDLQQICIYLLLYFWGGCSLRGVKRRWQRLNFEAS